MVYVVNCHFVHYPFCLVAQPRFSGLGLGFGVEITVRFLFKGLGLVQGRRNGSFRPTVVDQMGVDQVTLDGLCLSLVEMVKFLKFFLWSPPKWRETKGSKLRPFDLRLSSVRPWRLQNLNNFVATATFKAKLGW